MNLRIGTQLLQWLQMQFVQFLQHWNQNQFCYLIRLFLQSIVKSQSKKTHFPRARYKKENALLSSLHYIYNYRRVNYDFFAQFVFLLLALININRSTLDIATI